MQVFVHHIALQWLCGTLYYAVNNAHSVRDTANRVLQGMVLCLAATCGIVVACSVSFICNLGHTCIQRGFQCVQTVFSNSCVRGGGHGFN